MRDERGSALTTAVIVLALVTLLAGTALAYSLRGLDRTNRDRASARALAAADAGADIALWRMNRALVSGEVAGLLGFATDTLRTLGCVNVSVGGTLRVEPLTGPGWCAAVTEDTRNSATFSYWVSNGIHVGGSPSLIQRRVVAQGSANGIRRRLLMTSRLDLSGANALQLFTRVRWVECPPEIPAGASPDDGCPQPNV